ncbi:MAG: peptide MFS transporter [Pseudomonadota bacterium]|jgi:POT family proton-dependent oligopeptide transporter
MRFAPAVWRLVILEFWERYSYYGLMAILVLFLTSPVAEGGFGWTDSRALGGLSLFSAAAFILPSAGGWLADRFLGAYRSVLIGAALLLAGNVLLVFAAFTAPDLTDAMRQATLAGALFVIALGNGFFKSPLITLVGAHAGRDPATKDQAFRYYYQGIMLGTLAASLSVSTVADRVGWWAGFGLATVGMAISFAIFLLTARLVRDARGSGTAPADDAETVPGGPQGIALLCVFLPLITIGWVQFYGLWLLETERWVDREVGGFTMPSGWLLAINAIAIVILAPLVGRWWAMLRTHSGRPPGIVAKFASAFFVMGVAHLLMAWGFADAAPGGVSLLWPVGCLVLITVGEAIFWPSTYGAVNVLAPPRAKSLVMGIWLAMLGVGMFLTHQVARLSETVGFSSFSLGLGAAMLMGGVLLLLASRPFAALRTV